MMNQQQQRMNQAIPTVQYNSKQYDRIRFLGKGSFGSAVVHRRRHDCSLVVLKEIDLKKFKGEREKWSAINEARIMSTLNHVNIIKYHNAYTTDTKLIIEMEYASMGTLAVYLSYQMQPLEEQEILVIFRQIAAGLKYLHSRNIVHLDLKMSNIFVTIEGLVKIGDFGISQYIHSDSDSSNQQQFHQQQYQTDFNSLRRKNHSLQQQPPATSSHFGTLAYSSPERCLGELTDFKSDIWSLGCILYELITSEPLFVGNSLAELVLNITQIRYKPIKRNMTTNLRDIFEKSISRYPQDRPSAKDLLFTTDQFLSRIQLIKHKINKRQTHHNRFDLSTEVALLAAQNQDNISQINYLHSLVYQVRLSEHNIKIERVNLPQTKRIKEISKGRSHYLVLTYDNIVYGWGSKTCGQLGAFGLTSSTSNRSRSARSSIYASTKSFSVEQAARQATTIRASSATSSLASSTQTLSTATSVNKLTTNIDTQGSQQQQQQQHLSKQLVMSMLEESQPTTRPFIINELNHRKIIQVAAGDNFSVFLSKTGIVMTCGDGSSGCLGRGDLRSCFTPSMVESLLNSDVVCIGCGPKHVVAVCGNGRAFAWGKNKDGRLGIGGGYATGARSKSCEDDLRRAKYILRPQPVLFDENVCVKSVFCGDKCTVFIDSENRSWACGENRFNKLGFDIKRRFKKPLIVDNCFQPIEIAPLSKYRIVTCSIGKNHSTFISSEGKLFVFGQDIDHTYRLKCNNICTRDCQRRMSLQLQPKQSRPVDKDISRKSTLTKNKEKQIDGHFLTRKFETTIRALGRRNCLQTSGKDEEVEIDRFQRKQLESFVKKSRIVKKMPFECVISVSCTPKFTLALTNDNRVYFWGTRSHEKNNETTFNEKLRTREIKMTTSSRKTSEKMSVEPQLVSGSSDECFIKIGGTNNSLMSNIQILGSDQPIIQAQDPRLKANSLSDLWILDYKPSGSSSDSDDNDSSSLSASSSSSSLSINNSYEQCCPASLRGRKSLNQSDCQSICSLCCNQSTASCDNSSYKEDIKYDAILEPQPIVSLYVPSMFNHNGCSLHIVDLFCFDEDRFFLILDTTVKLQHSGNISRPMTSNSMTSTRSSFVATTQSSPKNIRRSSSRQSDRNATFQQTETQTESNLLNLQSNSSKSRIDDKKSSDLLKNQSEEVDDQLKLIPENQYHSHSELTAIANNKLTVLIESVESANLSDSCCRLTKQQTTLKLNEKIPSSFDGNNNDSNGITATSFSHGGISMDEPRSLSTFATSFGNQVIVGPSMRTLEVLENEQPLEPLLFSSTSQVEGSFLEPKHLEGINSHQSLGRSSSRRKRTNKKSESNTTNVDETSSMPSWVKNEYIQQCQQQMDTISCNDELNNELGMFALDSSATEDNEINGFACLAASDNLTIRANEETNYNFLSSHYIHDNQGEFNLLTEQNQKAGNESFFYGSLTCDTSLERNCQKSLSHHSRNAISQSQPDMSDLESYYLKDPTLQVEVTRRASIVNDGTGQDTQLISACNSRANLLQCNVYRASAQLSSNINSALSSRSNSNNPLTTSPAYLSSRFNSSYQHNINNRTTMTGSPSLEVAEFHELAAMQAEEADLYWARLGGSINLRVENSELNVKEHVLSLKSNKQSKTASSSSLASFRKSLVKLFC